MPTKFRLYDFRNRGLVHALGFLLSTSAWGGTATLATDKAAHFGLSSVAVEATMKSCQALEGQATISRSCRLWSSGLVLTAGYLKEVSDQNRGGRLDEQDLVANFLGVVTGNLLQWNF